MKKLYFIDNDNLERSLEDAELVQRMLECEGLSEKYLESMTFISSFGTRSQDEMYKILFDKNKVICSFSMYTWNHFGSLQQMMHFLATAGRGEVEGATYIDGSGLLMKALKSNIRDSKDCLAILNAIESNNIIFFEKDDKPCRIRVDIKGLYESPFKTEPVNLLDYFDESL